MKKIWERKSADDISPWMIHFQNLSYGFYIAYGVIISDIVYIVSSVISVVQNLIILGMYLKFRKRENEKSELSQTPEKCSELESKV